MNSLTLAQTNTTNSTIASDALISSDFGLLSMTLLIGAFFFIAAEFRSPIGVIFTGLTSLSMIGFLSGFVTVDVLFISAFVTIIMLTLAAIHSVG